jgi:hypothetical protein
MKQHFQFQGPPKFTQTGIFGSKINHLATLRQSILAIRIIFQSVTGFHNTADNDDE